MRIWMVPTNFCPITNQLQEASNLKIPILAVGSQAAFGNRSLIQLLRKQVKLHSKVTLIDQVNNVSLQLSSSTLLLNPELSCLCLLISLPWSKNKCKQKIMKISLPFRRSPKCFSALLSILPYQIHSFKFFPVWHRGSSLCHQSSSSL